MLPALALLLALQAKPEEIDPLSFDRRIQPLMRNLCFRCHNADKKKGNVNLEKDTDLRLILQERKTWTTALEAVRAGEMPPKKEKQPTDEQRKHLIAFIEKTLGQLDCNDKRDPGKPSIRRLNRAEYDNSVLELTGLDLKLADEFSPDASSYGFDSIAEALSLSPVLVEQYHGAAKKLVAAILAKPEARQRVFIAAGQDRDAARQIAARFALKAFRRPAEEPFLTRLLLVYDKARGKGQTHDSAVGSLLTAILISPRFLVRIETALPDVKGPYAVDDYDLASRLSFFLWSAPPDDELLALAAKGGLSSPGALEAQTKRLLADPRSRALADNFFGQWLQLRGLATHKPDAKLFPQFTPSLKHAMQEELDRTLSRFVREDRPLLELVDADFVWVNEELARHYGLDGVKGGEFRRVAIQDRRRGGLLTSAAVLMLQADTDRNNVPRRGNYIAASILGTPPPPPPPDVPQLEETKDTGAKLTLRQRLELHRTKPECMSCHVKIDPLGFSLENYDAIGRWRDVEEGAPVDASGVLPNGRVFKGPVELKQVLLEKKDDFVRVMTENLLIYALGRGLQPNDECVVRDARKAAAEGGYRFSTLVLTIVKSQPFRMRRNPEY